MKADAVAKAEVVRRIEDRSWQQQYGARELRVVDEVQQHEGQAKSGHPDERAPAPCGEQAGSKWQGEQHARRLTRDEARTEQHARKGIPAVATVAISGDKRRQRAGEQPAGDGVAQERPSLEEHERRQRAQAQHRQAAGWSEKHLCRPAGRRDERQTGQRSNQPLQADELPQGVNGRCAGWILREHAPV